MARKETERDRLMRDAKQAGTQPQGFKGWFKNVFLEHYIIPTLVALAAVALVVVFIVDISQDHYGDFTLTIMSDIYFEDEDKAELQAFLEETVGDANENGEIEITIVDQAMVVGGGAESDAAQKLESFGITFIGDPSRVLCLIHEDYLEYFDPESSYRPLSDFGIESEDEYFLYANDSPLIERLLPDGYEGEYYFAFKTCEVSKRDDPEFVKHYDRAVAALEAIMGAK